MKQIEKLKVEDVKPSSRQYPFIRFMVDSKEKLHRHAVEAKGLFYGKLDLTIEAGEKVAIVGPNGVGKTTLIRCLAGQQKPDGKGAVKWAEKARPGYWPQDAAEELKAGETLAEWMSRWRRKGDDEQIVRATLGQLLFSGDDQKKTLEVISGGEAQRMIIGKLVLTTAERDAARRTHEPPRHGVHRVAEHERSTSTPGPSIFVSHDREFVSSLATRIIELKPDGTAVDFRGSYDEYLAGKTEALAA
jgi:ATPase subunit of ABC transporter with duplicated ATPase domains